MRGEREGAIGRVRGVGMICRLTMSLWERVIFGGCKLDFQIGECIIFSCNKFKTANQKNCIL